MHEKINLCNYTIYKTVLVVVDKSNLFFSREVSGGGRRVWQTSWLVEKRRWAEGWVVDRLHFLLLMLQSLQPVKALQPVQPVDALQPLLSVEPVEALQPLQPVEALQPLGKRGFRFILMGINRRK